MQPGAPQAARLPAEEGPGGGATRRGMGGRGDGPGPPISRASCLRAPRYRRSALLGPRPQQIAAVLQYPRTLAPRHWHRPGLEIAAPFPWRRGGDKAATPPPPVRPPGALPAPPAAQPRRPLRRRPPLHLSAPPPGNPGNGGRGAREAPPNSARPRLRPHRPRRSALRPRPGRLSRGRGPAAGAAGTDAGSLSSSRAARPGKAGAG